MEDWNTATRRGLLSGAVASALSTAALAALGKAGTDSTFAPTNAISHWIWGDQAARHDGPSLRYTATGYVIHHLSATFWRCCSNASWVTGSTVSARRQPWPQPPPRRRWPALPTTN
jgi:hypothetical protein